MLKIFIIVLSLIVALLIIAYLVTKLSSIRYRVVEVNDNNAVFHYEVQKHLYGITAEWFTISCHHTKEEAMSELAWIEEKNTPPKVKVLKEIWA